MDLKLHWVKIMSSFEPIALSFIVIIVMLNNGRLKHVSGISTKLTCNSGSFRNIIGVPADASPRGYPQLGGHWKLRCMKDSAGGSILLIVGLQPP